MPDHDVTIVAGIEVTTPARTAIDLARWRERPDALAYLDAMLRAGLVVREDLLATLEESAGLPWIEQGREMVDLADGRAESSMESRMRLRYIDAGFPTPECQIPIVDDDGVERYRLDCGVKRLHFGLEYDGVEFHGPDQVEHDTTRRRWIASRGWAGQRVHSRARTRSQPRLRGDDQHCRAAHRTDNLARPVSPADLRLSPASRVAMKRDGLRMISTGVDGRTR